MAYAASADNYVFTHTDRNMYTRIDITTMILRVSIYEEMHGFYHQQWQSCCVALLRQRLHRGYQPDL